MSLTNEPASIPQHISLPCCSLGYGAHENLSEGVPPTGDLFVLGLAKTCDAGLWNRRALWNPRAAPVSPLAAATEQPSAHVSGMLRPWTAHVSGISGMMNDHQTCQTEQSLLRQILRSCQGTLQKERPVRSGHVQGQGFGQGRGQRAWSQRAGEAESTAGNEVAPPATQR